MKSKLLLLTAIFFLFLTEAFAQIPQAISYQAIARNATGNAITNTTVSIRISVKDLSATGTTIYIETHTVTTNQFGLFTLAVGTGTVVSGTFATIPWATGAKYMKVEMDPAGGSSYLDMGTSQLISVPYALVAGSVVNSSAGDNWGTQTATTNSTLSGNGTGINPLGIAQQGAASGEVLKWNGTTWAPATDNTGSGADNWGTQTVISNSTLTGAGTFASPLGLAQQGAANGQTLKWNGVSWAPANDDDQQTLSLAGNNLSISNGNSVTLPTGTTYTAGTGITIAGNVISNSSPNQTVSITGGGATIVGGAYPNFTVTSTDNDAQTLTLVGTNLSISNGNSVTLPTGTTYTAGTGISIAGNVITNTGDLDNNPTNELQTLSLTGTTLSISNGNSVTLPAGGGSDNWGTQTAVTDATLTGNGTAGSPLGIAQQGATTGQLLQWNGTTWIPATVASATTLGQSVTSVYGTSALAVTSATGFTLLPGLIQTINVPAGYSVLITTSGGLQTSSAAYNGYSSADIAVIIDGVLNPAGGGYQRLIAANTGAVTGYLTNVIAYWSMHLAPVLTAGSHTIEVWGAYNLGANCSLSGDGTSVNQGELTITLIKN